MTIADWLLERMAETAERDALIVGDRPCSYRELLDRARDWRDRLHGCGVRPGEVVWLEGDYGPGTCAALLALIAGGAIVVPWSPGLPERDAEWMELAEAGVSLHPDGEGWRVQKYGRTARHELLRELAGAGRPGLVLFTSGSTGTPKAIVHDFGRLLAKYRRRREALRTLSLLLFDHIGGINTLLHTLANGGTLVCPAGRAPQNVAAAIERHRVELLPATPSFLQLLLMTEAHRRFDLSTLKIVTYGTEVMHDGTLEKLLNAFPGVSFRQTYGLSELGILRVRPCGPGSLWMQVGGEGIETRIVDGLLHIRSDSAMLGYLNAPNPFDPDGWFNTQDEVVVSGDAIRIVGRRSEIVNVGGLKVHPLDVEEVLLRMPQIADAVVSGRPHPLLGQVPEAVVNVREEIGAAELKRQIREFCRGKLERHQVPVYVAVRREPLHTERFKKIRHRGGLS
ncbi:class I adenylate-forming enzyme family protein [Cohnella zeiphila]|uniref:Long-chain fatty acid--CoA ligase n=1 Tax=Cohnella zeiphila TaxID=2761120 RepID=A0A7X0VVK8_9BACL|nr:fatty acid--CoA ligase family protein [Cohnella zeiphila]MBB6729983.1 long-chain fatty acid--CoA ligase [Cohnella zeiphila]